MPSQVESLLTNLIYFIFLRFLEKGLMKSLSFIKILPIAALFCVLPSSSWADENDGTCSAGRPIESSVLYPNIGSYMQLYLSLSFSCGGHLTRWDYLSKTASEHHVYLSVWRPVGDNNYQLVGTNIVNATHPGMHSFYVPEPYQIYVEAGDFIGLHYETPNISQYALIVPYVDVYSLQNTFKMNELSDVLSAPLGHTDILRSNGLLDTGQVTSSLLQKSRLPALKAVVSGMFPSFSFKS